MRVGLGIDLGLCARWFDDKERVDGSARSLPLCSREHLHDDFVIPGQHCMTDRRTVVHVDFRWRWRGWRERSFRLCLVFFFRVFFFSFFGLAGSIERKTCIWLWYE